MIQDKPIFLPLESQLNALIANARLKMSVFLQFLKETGVDSGEAWNLRWVDIDSQRSTVSVIPTKNHNSRILPVSSNLLSRLFRLPRKEDRVFACKDLDDFRRRYEEMRNKRALGEIALNALIF